MTCVNCTRPSTYGECLRLRPGCACPQRATCGRLTVPLDHSGATPGTLSLAYARLPATGIRTGTIALLPGGPGQTAISFAKDVRAILADVRPSYDILLIDPRGTGGSAATECTPPRMASLTTSETIDDLEDVRKALGIDRLTLLGLSYGTYVQFSGQAPVVEVREADLLAIVKAADFEAVLRSELPAAIASLAHGDAAPLLHAYNDWQPGENASTQINLARFWATDCSEGTFPWAPDAPLAGRSAALRRFATGLGTGPFAGFDLSTVVDASLGEICSAWPPTPRPPAVDEALPDVPVLVLSGQDDLRTPVEGARRIAAQFPHGSLFVARGTGHSVLRNETGGCARRALDAFLTARTAASCTPQRWPAAPYRPARMATPAAVRETIAALLRDRSGAFSSWIKPQPTYRLPGLRSGYALATRYWLTLHAVEWFRGVKVSGRVLDAGVGRLSVAGHGVLTIRGNHMTGRLDGHRVRLRVPYSAVQPRVT